MNKYQIATQRPLIQLDMFAPHKRRQIVPYAQDWLQALQTVNQISSRAETVSLNQLIPFKIRVAVSI